MKTARQSDAQLWKELKRGDAEAYARLYDEFYPHLCYFANQLTKNKPIAEDIASSAVEVVLLRFNDFGSLDNIKAYLYRTVRNKCIDYFRHEKKEHQLQQEMLHVIEPSEESIMEAMVMAEFLQSIYKEIENLPPTRRSVFKLFYIDELSLEEISAKLNMKPSAVRFNKCKATEQLRSLLFEKKLLTIIGCVVTKWFSH